MTHAVLFHKLSDGIRQRVDPEFAVLYSEVKTTQVTFALLHLPYYTVSVLAVLYRPLSPPPLNVTHIHSIHKEEFLLFFFFFNGNHAIKRDFLKCFFGDLVAHGIDIICSIFHALTLFV